MVSDTLIRRYYRCFNERRLDDAAALFTTDADVQGLPGQQGRGGAGYVRFAETWISAFPNATFSVERIEPRRATLAEAYLLATGIHRGLLEFGMYRFQPSGNEARLHVRELLDIHNGKIAASLLSIDLNDFVVQLVKVDYRELADRVERIWALREDLTRAIGDVAREREVVSQLGAEIDAARRTLRPYFKR